MCGCRIINLIFRCFLLFLCFYNLKGAYMNWSMIAEIVWLSKEGEESFFIRVTGDGNVQELQSQLSTVIEGMFPGDCIPSSTRVWTRRTCVQFWHCSQPSFSFSSIQLFSQLFCLNWSCWWSHCDTVCVSQALSTFSTSLFLHRAECLRESSPLPLQLLQLPVEGWHARQLQRVHRSWPWCAGHQTRSGALPVHWEEGGWACLCCCP